MATGVTYQRAVRVLARHLDCEPTEQAVYERRLATDPVDYASLTLRASGAELLLVDDGYPPADVSIGWQELGRLAGCPSRPCCGSSASPRARRATPAMRSARP